MQNLSQGTATLVMPRFFKVWNLQNAHFTSRNNGEMKVQSAQLRRFDTGTQRRPRVRKEKRREKKERRKKERGKEEKAHLKGGNSQARDTSPPRDSSPRTPEGMLRPRPQKLRPHQKLRPATQYVVCSGDDNPT